MTTRHKRHQVQRDMQFIMRNKSVLKWTAIIGLVITVAIIGYFLRIDLFNRPELIQDQLQGTGVLAPIVYFLGSILNTIYPIVPGGLGNVVGYTVFGPMLGFTMAFTANLIGSLFLFYIARRFGRPILYAFFDERLAAKALSYLDRGIKMEWILMIVFIVPGLPDDIFTMIAGLSGLSYKRMMVLQTLFKPVTMFLYMAGVTNLFGLVSEMLI